MENMCSSSSSARSAGASALKSTGRRRCRPSIIQWITILALAPTSSSAREEVSQETPGRKERILPVTLPVENLGGTEYRKEDNGFPGLRFYEDNGVGNLGLEFTSNYDETETRSDQNALRWQWRHKTSGYSTSISCKSSKATKVSGKSSKTGAPSTSFSPTGANSSSSKASKSSKSSKADLCAPTFSPYPTLSDEPTISYAPSSSPSFSSMPTASDAPTQSFEPSAGPSVSSMPSVSAAPSDPEPSSSPSVSGAPSESSPPSHLTSGSGEDDTSTNSTTTSTTSWDDVDPDNNGPDPATCENIQSKRDNNPYFTGSVDADGEPERTDDDEDVDFAFDISFPVSYNSADFSSTDEVEDLLDEKLSTVISLWAAGCEQEAIELFEAVSGRRLQSDEVEYSEMSRYDAGGVGCTQADGADSCDIFDSTIIFQFDEGADIDEDDEAAIVAKIRDAFERFAPNLPGVIVALDALDIEKDDNFNAIIVDTNPVPDGSIAAGTVIGIAAAALAFILLLILLIRRRRDVGDEPSHFKLDDDAEEDHEATFIREFQTDPSSEGSSPYKTRSAHVVGEADSVISGWTGFTKNGHAVEIDDDANNNTGKLGHAHGDVHMCSSATCEVCELRRRNGVQFQPTGTPSRSPSHLPTDLSREYISEDTVEL